MLERDQTALTELEAAMATGDRERARQALLQWAGENHEAQLSSLKCFARYANIIIIHHMPGGVVSEILGPRDLSELVRVFRAFAEGKTPEWER